MREARTSLALAAVAALALLPGGAAAQVAVEKSQAANGASITRIKANGRSAFANLNDGETSGFLTASLDEVTGSAALDFAYATPDPDDANRVILVQGAGEIPASAFAATDTAATLSVTTPFATVRCVVNLDDGEFICAEGVPVTFELRWTQVGFMTTQEKTKRIEVIGPLTIRSHGEFLSVEASISGTWDGYTALDNLGNLFDTRSSSSEREITLQQRR